ncbi:16032_t:CDS:2 [Cetraspora pellucida]|uniref:16032_t:CDS:1 n=1 Tax=Cetraspora pellucida TaxID=1433469 RepID=A0ACA9LLV1_9GLOM|nr:16032_t:CDS:2 [Cetraspora pellucida]
MNIDKQQENIISTIDEQEENINSPNLEIDKESKIESSWSEEVELHSQILPDKNQNLEASTPEGNSLIPKMKTPTDPLATMYSSSPSQPANFQNKDEDTTGLRTAMSSEGVSTKSFFLCTATTVGLLLLLDIKNCNTGRQPEHFIYQNSRFLQLDKTIFFNNWAPQVDKRCINILAGDFNTNLNSQTNRISDSPPTSDPTRETLRRLTSEFIDIACLKQREEPYITYYQNTRGGKRMATRLNYIFTNTNYGHCCNSVWKLRPLACGL